MYLLILFLSGGFRRRGLLSSANHILSHPSNFWEHNVRRPRVRATNMKIYSNHHYDKTRAYYYYFHQI